MPPPAAASRQRGEPPLVSVVMPAFNSARWIGQTLESVTAQTYRNFEVLIVDDGSSDETVALVQAYARQDRRIRLLRQRNRGASAARNRGISAARGEYLAPIDSDDLWAPENLERQVAALEAAGPEVAFSFARSVWIDEQDRVLARPDGGPAQSMTFREILLRNPIGNGSASVYRREAVMAAGGYDPKLKSAEDWKLNLSVAARGTVLALSEPLVHYRIREGSKSHRFEIALRSTLKVVRDARRLRPDLPVRDHWNGRTQAVIWMLRRAVKQRRWGWALRMGAVAYLQNPLWFTSREARALLVSGLRAPFARLLKPQTRTDGVVSVHPRPSEARRQR